MSALRSFSGRVGRHTAVYAGGNVATFFFALVNIAVLTRFLEVEEFGEYAVFLFFSALLTVLYNLGSLQGGMMLVFGASEDGEEIEDDQDGPTAPDRRRTLTTVLAITAAIAGVGTAAIVVAADALVHVLTGDPDDVAALRIAAAAGGLGALWRLTSNVLRFERRPVIYVLTSLARPVLALGASVGLVVAGYGVEGALAGLAIGTAAATLIALGVGHRNYAWGLVPGIAPQILRRGGYFVPLTAGYWAIQNADLYLLSIYSPDDDVALYRVASRLGSGVSYFVAAVTMAWMPLTRSPIYEAVERERGRGATRSLIFTYFMVSAMWLVIALSVLADVLIRIAPSTYADAAPLIALLGLSFAVYGALVTTYRVSRFPRRLGVYLGLVLACALVFFVLAVLLIPPLGGYGAALAQIVPLSLAAAILFVLTKRSEKESPLHVREAVIPALTAAVFVVGVLVLGPELGDWRLALDLGCLIGFPILMVATGVVPREHVQALKRALRSWQPALRPSGDTELRERLLREGPIEREVLRSLVAEGRAPADVADALEMSEQEVNRRFVGALRAVGQVGEDGDADEEIGAYLLAGHAIAERDRAARALWKQGAEPLDLDALELVVDRLHRLPKAAWEEQVPRPAVMASRS